MQTIKNLTLRGIKMQYLWSFIIGGAICVIGQLLIDFTKLTPARILVLTALGLYRPLVEFAGAGATVPLTGFGYAIANGVKTAVDEQGALGILTGGLTATAAGITVAIILGIAVAVIFKPRIKKA